MKQNRNNNFTRPPSPSSKQPQQQQKPSSSSSSSPKQPQQQQPSPEPLSQSNVTNQTQYTKVGQQASEHTTPPSPPGSSNETENTSQSHHHGYHPAYPILTYGDTTRNLYGQDAETFLRNNYFRKLAPWRGFTPASIHDNGLLTRLIRGYINTVVYDLTGYHSSLNKPGMIAAHKAIGQAFANRDINALNDMVHPHIIEVMKRTWQNLDSHNLKMDVSLDSNSTQVDIIGMTLCVTAPISGKSDMFSGVLERLPQDRRDAIFVDMPRMHLEPNTKFDVDEDRLERMTEAHKLFRLKWTPIPRTNICMYAQAPEDANKQEIEAIRLQIGEAIAKAALDLEGCPPLQLLMMVRARIHAKERITLTDNKGATYNIGNNENVTHEWDFMSPLSLSYASSPVDPFWRVWNMNLSNRYLCENVDLPNNENNNNNDTATAAGAAKEDEGKQKQQQEQEQEEEKQLVQLKAPAHVAAELRSLLMMEDGLNLGYSQVDLGLDRKSLE